MDKSHKKEKRATNVKHSEHTTTNSSDDKRPHSKKRQRPKRIKHRPLSEQHANEHVNMETTIQRLEIPIFHSINNTNGQQHLTPRSQPILDADGKEQCIRVIHPYPYTFASFAKKRWVGRTVLDVYGTEFGSYPESYYKAAITQGRILVSGQTVDLSYRIQEKDVLTHMVHRHEPAVAVTAPTTANTSPATTSQSSLIKVIDETNDLIIVDKPGTMPIHPCGGYHLNSLVNILEKGSDQVMVGAATTTNPQQKKYFNIHRLDRLTSGLVILAKSSRVAKTWSQAIRERTCQKYYLARVRGRFPLNLAAAATSSSVERIQVGAGGQASVPHEGEWQHVNKDDDIHSKLNPVEFAKLRNAHGYWITDMSGKTVRDDVSLQEFAKYENTNVDEWLEKLSKPTRTCNDSTKSSDSSSMLWLHLACPTRIAEPKNGVCEAGRFDTLASDTYVNTVVKPAQTSFGIVHYDAASDSTVILCRPVTGRTHQIRLHCQYLGHPIANDPNYGGDIWYANENGKVACAKAQKLLGCDISGGASKKDKADNACATEFMDKNISDVPASVEEIDKLAELVQGEGESVEDFVMRTCVWCARCKGRDVVSHCVLEFLLRSRGIWLHALQYTLMGAEGDDKQSCFRTDLPVWSIKKERNEQKEKGNRQELLDHSTPNDDQHLLDSHKRQRVGDSALSNDAEDKTSLKKRASCSSPIETEEIPANNEKKKKKRKKDRRVKNPVESPASLTGGETDMKVADTPQQLAQEKEAEDATAVSFPFPTDPDDHCESPLQAYAHIQPFLAQLSSSSSGENSLRIYDPYFCNGAVIENLTTLGFPNVYNRKEDCYQVWSATSAYPDYDVFLTNPPYSGDHIERLIHHVTTSRVLKQRPWFLLMPDWVHKKEYFQSQMKRQNIQPFYLVPKKRYVYLPPKNYRSSKKSDVHKKSSPFNSMWYCWGGSSDRNEQWIKYFYNARNCTFPLVARTDDNGELPPGRIGTNRVPLSEACDLARSKSGLRDLRRKK